MFSGLLRSRAAESAGATVGDMSHVKQSVCQLCKTFNYRILYGLYAANIYTYYY